jgi:hypothetical protein
VRGELSSSATRKKDEKSVQRKKKNFASLKNFELENKRDTRFIKERKKKQQNT